MGIFGNNNKTPVDKILERVSAQSAKAAKQWRNARKAEPDGNVVVTLVFRVQGIKGKCSLAVLDINTEHGIQYSLIIGDSRKGMAIDGLKDALQAARFKNVRHEETMNIYFFDL